jgi:hypothetical protein
MPRPGAAEREERAMSVYNPKELTCPGFEVIAEKYERWAKEVEEAFAAEEIDEADTVSLLRNSEYAENIRSRFEKALEEKAEEKWDAITFEEQLKVLGLEEADLDLL